MSDPEAVRGLLERFGITSTNPPRDTQVIELMSTLACLAAEGNVICDVGALVRTLVSYVSVIYAHDISNPFVYFRK
jgi:CCR4-NOT transcription complex subunit 1